jgi:hypothetical protein
MCQRLLVPAIDTENTYHNSMQETGIEKWLVCHRLKSLTHCICEEHFSNGLCDAYQWRIHGRGRGMRPPEFDEERTFMYLSPRFSLSDSRGHVFGKM